MEVKVVDDNAKRYVKLAARLGLDPVKLRAATSGSYASSEVELGTYLQDPSVWSKLELPPSGARRGEKPVLGQRAEILTSREGRKDQWAARGGQEKEPRTCTCRAGCRRTVPPYA